MEIDEIDTILSKEEKTIGDMRAIVAAGRDSDGYYEKACKEYDDFFSENSELLEPYWSPGLRKHFGLEEHNHKTDKLVRSVLKEIARKSGLPYRDILMSFKSGDYEVAVFFWAIIFEKKLGEFSGVDFCHTCKKFVLYPA